MRWRSLSNKKSSFRLSTEPQVKIGHLTFGIFLRVDLGIRQNAPGVKAERQRAVRLP